VVDRKVVSAEHPELEPPASYDAILLAEVDHYFSDEVAWLKEATRALKPAGRIVISNRIHHRPRSLAAAQRAGLKLVSESTPVPTHFIAVFTAGPAGPAAPARPARPGRRGSPEVPEANDAPLRLAAGARPGIAGAGPRRAARLSRPPQAWPGRAPANPTTLWLSTVDRDETRVQLVDTEPPLF